MGHEAETAARTILIVDDNPLVIKLLDAVLSHAGYRVAQADRGERALALTDAQRPDLILLDLDMPGISGLETCRALKKNPNTADIPVIFVTASMDKNDIVAGFSAGAQDYILKPSTKEELLARVRTHLALCQTLAELKASEARYRELSSLDGLTGLYNTRHLYQTLQEHLDHHPQRPVAVLFIDIDQFKLVVDTHGHLNGSRTIAELAAVMRSQLPAGGYGVSYGGDEFVIVLADHDRSAGARIAGQLRTAIEDGCFLRAHGLAIRITISCGVAAYPEDARSLTELLGNADHALFEAKKMGRNAVVAYTETKAGS